MANYIVADIGGTNARFAISTTEGITDIIKYEYTEGDTINTIFDRYCAETKLDERNLNIKEAVFAVAGVPQDFSAHIFTNGHWSGAPVDFTNLPVDVDLINDFGAQSYALLALEDGDFQEIIPSENTFFPSRLIKQNSSNKSPISKLIGKLKAAFKKLTNGSLFVRNAQEQRLSVIGPGTGLGVAHISIVNGQYLVESSEGSHAPIPVKTEAEWKIVNALQKQFGFVSFETVASGPGLVRTFNAITGNAQPIEPKEIEHLARQKNPAALQTIDFFTRTLARLAATSNLMKKSKGGIFIPGGVLPKLGDLFNVEVFKKEFHANDLSDAANFTKTTGVYAVTNGDSGLLGAHAYAQYGKTGAIKTQPAALEAA